jgi:hypothetical protein
MVNLFPVKFRLKFGFLWEALAWMKDINPRIVQPDNPFNKPEEVVECWKRSLLSLLCEGLKQGTEIDGYVEADFLGEQIVESLEPGKRPTFPQIDMVSLWYPWFIETCRRAMIPCTISTIIDETGSPYRAIAVYERLKQLDGLPPKEDFFLDIHWNFNPKTADDHRKANEIIANEAERVFIELRWAFPGYEISIGECDVDLDARALAAIMQQDPKDLILWR